MSWNYRIVRSKNDLRIFDVYYNEEGVPVGAHEMPTYVSGKTVAELREQLQLMSQALEQPILDEDQIGSGEDTNEHQ